MIKNPPANSGDLGLIPGWGRSPGEGNGDPLQYSCPENPKDRGAWRLQPMGSKRVGHNLATKQQQRVYDFSSVAQSYLTLCNSMDCSRQAPLSMGFSRQEYWSGLPFAPPGDLPDPRMEPGSPAMAGGFFTTESSGRPRKIKKYIECYRKCSPQF